MNNPFFSIVIPAYNRAYILPKTIGSVINQIFQDWELIVIDDGSKDNTREVISNIEDKRIKYIYQNNAERSAARNNGIKQSKGKYICFLDSDDWFEPNHLEVLFEKIIAENSPEALFFTNCFYYQNGIKTRSDFPELVSAPDYLLQNPIIPGRVCVHSKILEKYKFREDIVIVEDQVLWVTIAYHYPVFHIPIHTMVYHLHEDNSINIKNNCFRPRLNGLRLLFNQKDVTHLISKQVKKNMIGDCYYGISKHYFYKREFFKMIWSLCLSFGFKPYCKQNKSKLFMVYQYLFETTESY